jgi:hypothetical protein
MVFSSQIVHCWYAINFSGYFVRSSHVMFCNISYCWIITGFEILLQNLQRYCNLYFLHLHCLFGNRKALLCFCSANARICLVIGFEVSMHGRIKCFSGWNCYIWYSLICFLQSYIFCSMLCYFHAIAQLISSTFLNNINLKMSS